MIKSLVSTLLTAGRLAEADAALDELRRSGAAPMTVRFLEARLCFLREESSRHSRSCVGCPSLSPRRDWRRCAGTSWRMSRSVVSAGSAATPKRPTGCGNSCVPVNFR